MDSEDPQVSFSTKELWTDIRDELRSMNQLLLLKADLSHVKELETRIGRIDLEGSHTAQRLELQVSDMQRQIDNIEALNYPAATEKTKQLDELEKKYEEINHNLNTIDKKIAFYAGGLAILLVVLNFGLEKGWF